MNEMASKSIHIISSLVFLFFVTVPFAYAKHYVPSRISFPERMAEKLIMGLNLHPKEPINIVDDSYSPSVAMPRIVESRFKFPNLMTNGTSVGDLGHHTGYYKLPHSKAARIFYYFFESRNSKTDPVVIWLTGGPGCSSSTGLFYENGPFHLTKNLSLVWNDYGWDKASNILYVDQPIGTGYSYTSDPSDIRHNEDDVSNDLYDFMQEFFKRHPQFVKNDFYITGESYAGHYIPAFAYRVHKGNKADEGIHINLKGFAIGNSRWVYNMKWSGQKEYQVAKTVPFLVNHVQAGSLKSHGPLSFLKVYNAGHLVPMDQPEAALEMLKSWMNGTLA